MACNLCGSQNFRVFLKGTASRKYFLSATSQEYVGGQIVRCSRCGLVYRHSIPPAAILEREYSRHAETAYLESQKERSRSFARSLLEIKKYMPSGKLLDVGSAAGLFLNEAKKVGFEVLGVEPNKYLANYAHKTFSLKVYQKTFDKFDIPERSIDIVTFWDVLEHLPNPLAALRKTHRILARGGVAVINYPDINSLPARLLGRHWWFVISGHLYYFTPQTISKMLREAGFKVIRDKRHFQILSLSYLFTRLGRYSKNVGSKLSLFSKKLGIGNLAICYWAGQRTVIAGKD
ncbi:hypothetical protein A3D84_02335 [Candidatus Woesebacteria bacterium RIFCSPHIGHO2_02_FULL_42_20]|uniref:Methyltransferase type 11 domain-containing protein n=1 Tax=Candidatus Woesebacteria bacterium RIFCSPHIGHO2_12_FULL_41_24 TaxID=1802510 RepID=A0A1F8ASX4_9BACT|nr:MAG: hypothetical protein A2W15_00095 [Candidatus Woesebacteria bacterium RBG_16_41_13]OGM29427.1 MAG: hypothetical protein A2873_05040 [Candidatus Woesebacteria bacterium RIFCSPHIGHO2_01_FULL_42_80]OGM35006.1 MAG: hypothetical protein A3D84_02335 [Candidatus Woesebacteria bacterium RIFCSPHIGHO2_02_FULL_42_20]OGM54801.1 MAG: hypothetical protein A3E44_01430 [Candidatus Woesebacteria bacterium RIFCSPHIGHO2_12_FULL_41_24]OGM68321.1 MAG: hypothetical protein A2969_02950 [Candidatus Woesebacteri